MGGVLGGLLYNLLDRKHNETRKDNVRSATYGLDRIGKYLSGEIDMPLEAVQMYGTMVGKTHPELKDWINTQIAAKQKNDDIKQRQGLLAQSANQTNPMGQGTGIGSPQNFSPVSPAMKAAAAGPQPQQQQQSQLPPIPEDDAGPMASSPPLQQAPNIPVAGSQPQANPTLELTKQSGDKTVAGFGVRPELTAPPPDETEGGMRWTPATRGRRAAAEQRPLLETQNAVANQGKLALDQMEYEARSKRYENDPSFRALPARQQFQLKAGQQITPELFRNVPGPGISNEDDVGLDGKTPPLNSVGSRMFVEGRGVVFIPGRAETQKVLTTINPDGTTTANQYGAYSGKTPDGQQIGSVHGVNPAMLPHTTDTGRDSTQFVNVGSQVLKLPVHSNTRVTRSVMGVPFAPQLTAPPAAGAAPAPAATAPAPRAAAPARPAARASAAPAPAPTANAAAPGGKGEVIGETPAAYKMRIENQYTPNGQKAIALLEPKMLMMKRIIDQLKPLQNDNRPASEFFNTLKYRIGYAGDNAELINEINLSGLGQAGSVIQGMSRAKEILNKALVHVPDTWKDSHKNMYRKMVDIYKNMDDMKNAINKYETKYPGRDSGITNPGNVQDLGGPPADPDARIMMVMPDGTVGPIHPSQEQNFLSTHPGAHRK